MEFGQRPDPRRRLVGLGFVIGLHALIIWGLIYGLARKVVELLPPPIETKILKELVEQEEAPPPPPPKFETPPPPFIPPPEINIQQAAAPRPNAITTTTTAPPPVAAPAPPAARKAPVVKAKNCREPDYPAVSERLGETGSVVLQLLVGVDGKVTESKVETSSGFPRLDKAAVDGLSRCRFTPGSNGGVPEAAWAQIKYTFKSQK